MTLDGGRISITALSPLTARQHPPILPFLLAYMSGLCLGQKSLELGKSRNADELGRALKQDAQDFLDGGDFTDDFTLVIVEAEG